MEAIVGVEYDGKAVLDISSLVDGIYILRLIHQEKTIVKSFTVNQGRK